MPSAVQLLLLLAISPVFGNAESVKGSLGSESYLAIDGDSTMHKWTSTTAVIGISLNVSSEASKNLPEALRNNQVAGIEIKIPVSELKSGEPKLDKNLQKAMDIDEFPEVIYRIDNYDNLKSTYCSIVVAKVYGLLTIHGKANLVAIEAEFQFEPGGVKISGNYTLKMSDYGVRPPTMMLGMIKVRDPVTIRFHLYLNSVKQ